MHLLRTTHRALSRIVPPTFSAVTRSSPGGFPFLISLGAFLSSALFTSGVSSAPTFWILSLAVIGDADEYRSL